MSGERRPELPTQAESSHSLLYTEGEFSNTEFGASSSELPRFPKHRKLVESISTPTPAALRDLENANQAASTGNVFSRPKLDRMSSVRNAISFGKTMVSSGSTRISNKTAKFFGVTPPKPPLERQVTTVGDPELKWARRRLRYISRRYSRYGGYKEGEAQKELGTEEPNDNIDLPWELATTPAAVTPSVFEQIYEAQTPYETPPSLARSVSVDSTGKQRLFRRDSVAKMAWDGVSFFMHRGAVKSAFKRQSSKTSVSRERSSSMSFAPVVVQPVRSGSISRRSSTSPGMETSPKILGSAGSPFIFKRRLPDYDLGSADSRRSGKMGYEAIQMSKIEEEPDLSFRNQSTDQSSGDATAIDSYPEVSGTSKASEASGISIVSPDVRKPGTVGAEGFGRRFGEGVPGSTSDVSRFPVVDERLKPVDAYEVAGPSTSSEMGRTDFGESITPDGFPDKELADVVRQVFPMKMDSFISKNQRESEAESSIHFPLKGPQVADSVTESFAASRGDRYESDEQEWDEEGEAFFGVDQISLAAEEDFRDTGAESLPSFTSYDRPSPAAGPIQTSVPQYGLSQLTTASTSIPSSFALPQTEQKEDQERGRSHLLRQIPSTDEDRDVSRKTDDSLPLQRPTSLGLIQGGRWLQHSRIIADDSGSAGRFAARGLPEDFQFPAKPVRAARAKSLQRQDAFDVQRFLGRDQVEERPLRVFPAAAGEGVPSAFSEKIQRIRDIFRVRGPRLPKSRFHGVGFGIWRKFFRRRLNQVDRDTADEIESFEDHRPFFTYYVTSVQILVCLASIFFHGFGPVGFDRREQTASVLHTSVVLRQVSIYELENFWLGPKFSDLVHLGAKYSPCMRRDPQIYEEIEKERELEKQSGCCVYNDGVGCFQATRNECPNLIATLVKWSKHRMGPNGRISGAVCGQDPSYCEDPVSVQPYVWPDDITKWPICRRGASFIPENQKHLQCEITGRPCCILLHGQCRITTREYCDFVHGYYHPNATLCSQVSCLNKVCGMLPFLYTDHPDQFYRLFLSLFLHAGVIHCAATVLIHWYYMRDLEKLIGWGRMAILYMGSGIGGNLASALLMPYKPEVGPSGSLIGIFSAMYADVIYNWKLIAKPWDALKELGLFTLLLFAAGTLPWIDNWAHIFGFLSGLLISLGTFPYINFGGYERKRRIYTIIGCWILLIVLYSFFLLRFYKWPSISWKWTEYVNCIPFTDHMCDDQGVQLKTWLNI